MLYIKKPEFDFTKNSSLSTVLDERGVSEDNFREKIVPFMKGLAGLYSKIEGSRLIGRFGTPAFFYQPTFMSYGDVENYIEGTSNLLEVRIQDRKSFSAPKPYPISVPSHCEPLLRRWARQEPFNYQEGSIILERNSNGFESRKVVLLEPEYTSRLVEYASVLPDPIRRP